MIETLTCIECLKRFNYDLKTDKWHPRPQYRPKYCSKECRQKGRTKRIRELGRGRFAINTQELSKAYLDDELSLPDLAKKFHVSWWTIYRRVKDLGLSRQQGQRRIFAPLDKTVFMLATSPLRDAELYVAIKDVLRQLHFHVSVKVYDSTYRHPRQPSVIEEIEAVS